MTDQDGVWEKPASIHAVLIKQNAMCEEPLSRKELESIARSSLGWKRDGDVSPESDAREQAMPTLAQQTWAAFTLANSPERFFVHAGQLVRATNDPSTGSTPLQELGLHDVRDETQRVARWVRMTK